MDENLRSSVALVVIEHLRRHTFDHELSPVGNFAFPGARRAKAKLLNLCRRGSWNRVFWGATYRAGKRGEHTSIRAIWAIEDKRAVDAEEEKTINSSANW